MTELEKRLYDVPSILLFRIQTMQSNFIRRFNASITNIISHYLDSNFSQLSHKSDESRYSKSRKL